MNEPPVVDASPLIYLGRCDLIDFLRLSDKEVVVPAAVADEIRKRGSSDPTVRAIAGASWMRVVPTPAIPKSIQSWDLGNGESSVISWALAHPGTTAVLDDLAARRCAETLALPCIGTLGLVLRAKRQGRIPAARPVVVALRLAGLYLSDAVVDRALALVEE